MRVSLTFLARHRWAGVGLGLLVEIALLVALALAPPSDVVGMPAAVAAAIAGSLAVVFGVVDGVAVALAGAVVFAALGGWKAGELVAIGIWPAIVAVVGLFARRIEQRRLALRRLVAMQEEERRTLALTLHDESAQTLTGALLRLRAAARHTDGTSAAAAEEARVLVDDTIQALRGLAGDLSPKALEDFGLAAALARLADTTAGRAGIEIGFDGDWDGRLPDEEERALFRFAQAALEATLADGAGTTSIRLANERGRIVVAVHADAPLAAASDPQGRIASAGDHLRTLGGKLDVRRNEAGETVLRAELPAVPRAVRSG